MLLLTVRQWIGQDRAYPNSRPGFDPIETLEGLATRLPLREAITRLRKYEDAYGEAYGYITAVVYKLVSVAEIDDLTSHELEMGRIELVEDMRINSDERNML